ncbi:SHOCT domain-containing protein [Streptomyces sp. NPDC087908]|uniref:SHOCT domain-containing protein n=1 Tax=unclassified Streptomyces TaxID=2593676 RepID=UPI0011CE522C|nr:SHOCT domain-containing protein [Streptomyces sp. adm13(2018)]TXS26255.1 SHOCT domain-containing protein [Streptomyces sp. adm13(2018)]
MNTLAHTGPGPWVLLFPLVWAAAIAGIVTVARRAGWRRGRGRSDGPAGDSPLTLLGHRFAAGEIDEDEYWRRLTVLEEQFGRRPDTGGKRA